MIKKKEDRKSGCASQDKCSESLHSNVTIFSRQSLSIVQEADYLSRTWYLGSRNGIIIGELAYKNKCYDKFSNTIPSQLFWALWENISLLIQLLLSQVY